LFFQLKAFLFLHYILGYTLAGFLFPVNNIQYTFITNPNSLGILYGVLIAEHYKRYDIPRYIISNNRYINIWCDGFMISVMFQDEWLTLSGINSWMIYWGEYQVLCWVLFFENGSVLSVLSIT
jgi:hypothetical protein